MNVAEYNKRNESRYLMAFDGADLKKLYQFSEILKGAYENSVKGLIVDGDALGFTDTYMLAMITAKKCNSKVVEPKIYPMNIVADLKIAEALAILDDYTLALQIGGEITEFKPIEYTKPPRIARFSNDEENYSKCRTKLLIKAENYLWKMLERADVEHYYTEFKGNSGVVVFTPNEKSKIELDVFAFEDTVEYLKVGLNCRRLRIWLKFIKNNYFELSFRDGKSAVKFKEDNLHYILMPFFMGE